MDEAVVDIVAFGVQGDQADDGEDPGDDTRGEGAFLEVELHLVVTRPTRVADQEDGREVGAGGDEHRTEEE
ncbi:MAG TPA: hypothetical protein VHZ54_00300, partial [Solirubrobacterales bacterium]|nr:hypothetical protein [Solirubrobacterales bacterium]